MVYPAPPFARTTASRLLASAGCSMYGRRKPTHERRSKFGPYPLFQPNPAGTPGGKELIWSW